MQQEAKKEREEREGQGQDEKEDDGRVCRTAQFIQIQ
jgi:hypothetical protein